MDRVKRVIASLRSTLASGDTLAVYSYDLSSATDRIPLHVEMDRS